MAPNSSACSCKDFKFCFNPAGHTITGDLKILNNCKLRDILSKGPKYREPGAFTCKQNSKLILDSVKEYTRRWAKKEDVEVDTPLSGLNRQCQVNRRITVLTRTMSHRYELVFDDPDVAADYNELHQKCVIVPADKASNNIVFVRKTHNCLMEELGISTTIGNPGYIQSYCAMSKDEILQNHHHSKFPSRGQS